MKLIKSLVKAPFSMLGLDLKRQTVDPIEAVLHRRQIRSVLDVGADVGNFSAEVRRALPAAHIYGFEPLPASFQRLQERFQGDASFTAFQTALGDQTGEIEFYQDEFAVASSALPFSDTCKTTFPQVGKTIKTKVPVQTLDGWSEGRSLERPLLMKMDVQGYERPVIHGGMRLLSQVDALIIEVSFVELYQGQALFCDIHSLLAGLGFTLQGIREEAPNAETGLSPYADAFYERLSA